MESNFERAAASKARMAAGTQPQVTAYPGATVKDILRLVGILNLVCGIIAGALTMSAPALGILCMLFGVVGSALLFALASIVENLMAIRFNTERR